SRAGTISAGTEEGGGMAATETARDGPAVVGAYPRIVKDPAVFRVAPNLADYEAARRAFDWREARALLAGLPGGQGLNIAHEAVDRHAAGPRADRPALRWIGRGRALRVFTWRDLR